MYKVLLLLCCAITVTNALWRPMLNRLKNLNEVGRAQGTTEERAAVVLPKGIRQEDIVQHHSFIPPLLEEYWSAGLQHWDFGLAAAVTDNYVRLTPAKQSREGYIWNNSPSHLTAWTIHLGFRTHSPHPLGGDGFALWYSEKPSTAGGALFGASEQGFKGLGIIFDTFDNNGKKDNPAVHVIVGNGNDVFRTDNDLEESKLGGCIFNFRNTEDGDVVAVTVEYGEGQVQIVLKSKSQELNCAVVSPVNLPDGYYFGLSAHTGHLADNHDIHYFIVTAREADRRLDADTSNEHKVPFFSHDAEKQEKERHGGK